MIVVNIFGAPGSGKSTTAHLLTGLLKKCHVSCELAGEYAKDIVLDQSPHFLTNQSRILGEQSWRVERIASSGADIAITDSPVALVSFYATLLYPERYAEDFRKLVLQTHAEWESTNFLLERRHHYETRGRYQTEEQSDEIGKKMISWLDDHKISATRIATSDMVAERIFCELISSGRADVPALGRTSARKIAASLLADAHNEDEISVSTKAIGKLAE